MEKNCVALELGSLRADGDEKQRFVSDTSGVEAVAAALSGGSAVLTSLNLADNALCGVEYDTGTYNPLGIQALASALEDNAVLTSLNLQANNIGPTEAIAIASALKEFGELCVDSTTPQLAAACREKGVKLHTFYGLSR
jgi:hypothetical protein